MPKLYWYQTAAPEAKELYLLKKRDWMRNRRAKLTAEEKELRNKRQAEYDQRNKSATQTIPTGEHHATA
jgi:hypothetical protein